MLKTLMMLIKKVNKRSAVFFIIGIFKDKGFKFQLNVCNGCHDLLIITANVKFKMLIIVLLLTQLAKMKV